MIVIFEKRARGLNVHGLFAHNFELIKTINIWKCCSATNLKALRFKNQLTYFHTDYYHIRTYIYFKFPQFNVSRK